jgi:excisionase family DNA binding protein
MDDHFMKPEEAGEFLGFASLTVRRMARAGRLPCYAIPRGDSGTFVYRFKREELEDWLENMRKGAKE